MKQISNVTEKGTTLILDDVHLLDCIYEDCRVIYMGGDFGWINTKFINCTLITEGPAARTQKFLEQFGWKHLTVPALPTSIGDHN